MSRYTIYHYRDKKAIAWGKDHACGEYLQIWTIDDGPFGKLPDCDNILVDEDRLTGFTREKMLELLHIHGFDFRELTNEVARIEAKNQAIIDDFNFGVDFQ